MKTLISLITIITLNANANIFSPVKRDQIPKGTPPQISLPPVEDANLFKGKHVAILASHGVEESELTFPYYYLTERGASVDIVVPSWTASGITTSQFLMPSLFVKATTTFREAQNTDYDLLVLTGGAWNAQVVRSDEDALRLIKTHYQYQKPVAAICAGAIILVNAGLTKGLVMTGSPVIKMDLENSGAVYKDESLVMANGVFTSRTPDDLPYFVRGLRRALIGR